MSEMTPTRMPRELERTAAAQIISRPAAGDNPEYEFSFSSEYPVDRGWGKEILSHAPGAMDTTRLDAGAVNLLFNHSESDLLGRITSGRLDSTRQKGYCKAVFSGEENAQVRRRQFDEGTLVNVSFRYKIHDWRAAGWRRLLLQPSWETLRNQHW